MAKLKKTAKTFKIGDEIVQGRYTIIITAILRNNEQYPYSGYQIASDNKKAIDAAKKHIPTFKEAQKRYDAGNSTFIAGQPLSYTDGEFKGKLIWQE